MIKRDHNLPVKRQAQLLDVSRSSVYYRSRPVRPDTPALMRRIDELHLELPFAGCVCCVISCGWKVPALDGTGSVV